MIYPEQSVRNRGTASQIFNQCIGLGIMQTERSIASISPSFTSGRLLRRLPLCEVSYIQPLFSHESRDYDNIMKKIELRPQSASEFLMRMGSNSLSWDIHPLDIGPETVKYSGWICVPVLSHLEGGDTHLKRQFCASESSAKRQCGSDSRGNTETRALKAPKSRLNARPSSNRFKG